MSFDLSWYGIFVLMMHHFSYHLIFRAPNITPLEQRLPLTFDSFLRDILPALLCYYATAFFVQLPYTYPIRIALLPFSLWLTFSAATRINVVGGFADERLIYWNQGYVVRAIFCHDISI